MNTPKHTTTKIIRHEWIIGGDREYIVARDLSDGIIVAERDMVALGVDISFDDAYKVRAGDGAEVILYVDIEEK